MVFRADLYIVAGLELPVHHMVLLHTHKGRIRICFAIAVSVSQYLFLLFVLLKVHIEVLYDISCLGLGLWTGLVIPFDDLVDLLGRLLHFLLIHFFKIRRSGITILIISNTLGILPHFFKLLNHLLLTRLNGIAPDKSITTSHGLDLGAVSINFL